ncbi:FkbM family methyltransferase [Shinella pollutisoli]|uniref:FkbM family methyltransferase n=1 Tax=Shinella pollutisoli TaxID=2250594 RepID=A0ABV7DFE6_9HYPH|nr:FkbM family methyltransferase [Shinella pollutisoli]
MARRRDDLKDNIAILSDREKSYQIFLPDHATDYIQKKVYQSGVAYELDMLRDMAGRLEPGDLVLDVGANVGNHSLYLAAVCGCHVVAYEPNTHLADAIVQSAKLNGLGKQIRVHAKGVGEVVGKGQFEKKIEENLGGQKLIPGQGDLAITTLDRSKFEQPVKAIKIDVEGMEMSVLRGADRLIARDRPAFYIECMAEDDFHNAMAFLSARNYLFWGTFNATPTHLFLPAEAVPPEQYLRHFQQLKIREVAESYRRAADFMRMKSTLDAANLKYRESSARLNAYRERVSTETSRADAADAAFAKLREKTTALEGEVRNLKRLLHYQFTGQAIESSSDSSQEESVPAGSTIAPEFVGAWALALPLPASEIAKIWAGLARCLMIENQQQAVALLRAVQELNPTPETARLLGLALIEAGDGKGGLDVLEPIASELNLSSREARLLALARAGHTGLELRARCEQAVRSRLRVAAIMDEFTATGYGPECDLQQLSVGNWEAELSIFRPQLLLIESAWRGLWGEWGPKVGQLSREVQGILEWCRAKGVPTVFWNKEDPVHFENFITTAQKFDLVFTTDIDCIPHYKAKLGHDRVYLLPFACQPELHNPIEIGERIDAFCFAGAYYVRYPDRIRDLDDFLARLSDHRSFEIFDRNFGQDRPDYMFPEKYRKYIIGTLSPKEIDKAYKGYSFGINMNSVKNSQSMFARRIYELLASNTRVVSNYSVGLRLMFGDLVVSTDSGEEALRRIRKQDDAGWTGRIRLAGLRKAMSEHTYSHRLAYVVRQAGLDFPDSSALPPVTVLAMATTREECERFIAQFSRQTLTGARMILVTADGLTLSGVALPAGIRRIAMAEAGKMWLHDLIGPGEWVAGFAPTDHYGANYLQDLILATRFSKAPVLGKAAHHRVGANGVEYIDGPTYRPVRTLATRRAALRWDAVLNDRLDTWLRTLPDAEIDADDMLALDPFNYCQEGAAHPLQDSEIEAIVDDLPGFAAGLPVSELLERASAMAPAIDMNVTDPFISGSDLFARIQPGANKIKSRIEGKDWIVTSQLADNKHIYLYEKESRPLSRLTRKDGLRLHGWISPGLKVRFVAVFYDKAMEKLGNQIVLANQNHRLEPPEGTEFVRFGVRLHGPGTCSIRGLVLGKRHTAPLDVISQSKVLLLTNHYPSYQDLYRNGFVHSRVRAYRELGGTTPDVYRLRQGQEPTWHEFQNITCMTGSAEQLDAMLANGRYDHVLVHFLDEHMWKVLARHIDRIQVTVWVHGAEVQPWWRRQFNYTTEEELAKAKKASDKRLDFWRSIFAPLSKNVHFVFVSQYFADEVFEDLAVECPAEQYEVIHNPIDGQLFAWHEKPLEQRGKILSIRPFASAKYANDLSVAAILALRKQEFFKDLDFHIIGDGVQFEEITAPLAGIANVKCERRFLSQPEIAALHRDYGVFLSPTRMDAQGVSRDEAMSSGLVPVTTRVAAIPEFVDESCGYMAEPEDAKGLAQAIEDLWKNPETFLQKSRAAAERVRRQSAKNKVIAAELALFSPVSPAGDDR